MPKFQIAAPSVETVEEKPREFEAFAFLPGQSQEKVNEMTARIKEMIQAGALFLGLDLSGDDMPTPERQQRGKGEGTNVFYGESKRLYAGFTDENSPVLVTAAVFRPVAAEAKPEKDKDKDNGKDDETNGNTETETDITEEV
jgi:hypothetical protein